MKWAICIKNTGYEASLEARKLYEQQADAKAQALGLVRVVDESGEGYLYPSEMFAPIAIEYALEDQLLAGWCIQRGRLHLEKLDPFDYGWLDIESNEFTVEVGADFKSQLCCLPYHVRMFRLFFFMGLLFMLVSPGSSTGAGQLAGWCWGIAITCLMVWVMVGPRQRWLL